MARSTILQGNYVLDGDSSFYLFIFLLLEQISEVFQKCAHVMQPLATKCDTLS